MSVKDAETRIEPEVFLTAYRGYYDKKRRALEAAADVQAALQGAHAGGIDIVAFKAVTKLTKMEPRDAQRTMRNILLYLGWLGCPILEYRDLIEDNTVAEGLTSAVMQTHKLWEVEREGYECGKRGDPVDNNPHPQGSSEHQLWTRSWGDGAADQKPKE